MVRIKLYKITSEDSCNYEQIFETTASQYWIDTVEKHLSWRMNMHASSQHVEFERIVIDDDKRILELTVFLTSEHAEKFIKWWYMNS